MAFLSAIFGVLGAVSAVSRHIGCFSLPFGILAIVLGFWELFFRSKMSVSHVKELAVVGILSGLLSLILFFVWFANSASQTTFHPLR